MAQISGSVETPADAGRAVLPLFVSTIFLSAFLLFGVQPMFVKTILPVLGGSPSVWSVAMVFFQAVLLAGYAYAHLLVQRFSVKTAALVHLAVMVGALATLPIGLAAEWNRPPANGEAAWLLGLFLISVGLPFFAVSANGPLLQAWFGRSGHRHAGDPYFLYAASNIGSFASLIAYPVLIEPGLTLSAQSFWWSVGFVLLGLLIAACAGMAGRTGAGQEAAWPAATAVPLPQARMGRERLGWMAVSFIPSGLLISVTAHISTDVAAAPLLWVVPLALFLLTFVLAFRDRPLVPVRFLVLLQIVLAAAVLLMRLTLPPLGAALAIHLGLFFVSATICHGTLYRQRPEPRRLTEFYLCLSAGGVLGGIFCALLAPRLFSTVLEYPILVVLALLCQPTLGRWRLPSARTVIAALAGILLLGAALALVPQPWLLFALFVAVASLMLLNWRRPEGVVLPAALLALGTTLLLDGAAASQSFRSFFGVNKVVLSADGRFRQLNHGTTVHGAMRIRNDDGSPFTGRPVPATYYAPDGPLALAIDALRSRSGTLPAVSVIGLGSGSLACTAEPGERWTFLEIDPEVVRIARDPSLFRFLSACAPQSRIVLGDARLTLADQPAGQSLIVLDAFSSDAIPNHLVTKEAMALYLSKLDARGVLLAHISNRHLELRNILARTAAELGLVTFVRDEKPGFHTHVPFRRAVTAVIIARQASDLGALAAAPGWTRVEPDLSQRPWTDDYSNIIEAIADKLHSH